MIKPPTTYHLPPNYGNLKVAIVHDWLIGGGAEKVVLELHRMFPDAPIYTSYATQEWRDKLDGKVITGYLQKWPFSKLRKYVPFLRAWWFSHLNLSGYDLVISSSGAEAKGIKVPKDTIHINYCHAPTHYYWSRYDEYMKHPGFGVFNGLARAGLKLLAGPMRHWDYKAAQRPHHIIANSTYTQSLIKKYYGRDSVVIHPPVDVESFSQLPPSNSHLPQNRSGFVITGRQTPYKRFDLAVQACSQLTLHLTVIGNGPEHEKLKRLAGPSITFKGWIPNEEVVTSLQSAEAFIFPGTDDFGISAVEALAAGTPVIAYKDGGALDYVIEGKTGLFFEIQTAESLAEVLGKFSQLNFDSELAKAQATKFSTSNFSQKLKRFIAAIT